jgi:dipeptidyl aminopeptidase/acylaminoacyl peptidase
MRQLFAVFLASSLVVVSSSAQTKAAPFTPQDMLQVVGFMPGSEPAVSPDGSSVAYAVTDTSLQSNILAAHPDGFLWLTKKGAKPVRLADGDYADTPVWSPDSHRIAFFRTHDTHRRLCVWNAANGAIVEVGEDFPKDTSLWPSGKLAPQWSADGKILVYPSLEPIPISPEPPSTLVHSTDAAMPFDKPFNDARTWTLWAADAATGQARRLTPQPVALSSFSVSPNGASVLYRAVIPETISHFRHERSQDWILPIEGGKPPLPILEGRTPSWITFSPKGTDLLFPEKGVLRSIESSGTGEKVVVEKFPVPTRAPQAARSGWLAFQVARPGTGPKDPKMYSILEPTWDIAVLHIGAGNPQILTAGDKDAQYSDLVWSTDGSSLFFSSVDQNTYRETISRWSAADSKREAIYSADRAMRALSVSANGSEVVFTSMSAASPENGYELNQGESQPHAVTDINPQLASFAFQEPRMFGFYSEDGDPLKALLYLPVGTDATHPVPVVTYVYEKLSEDRNRFNPEAQWYVSHGYGFLMPDVLIKVPHLSESYVKSVVPAVNAVRAMNLTTGRFGITGGSLGGLAGLSLISRTDIFTAAVLRAPPSDYFSTWGDGRDRDVWTIETGQGRGGGTPWDHREAYIENSPFFIADRVHTPVLIVHGEADFTVPFQQGLMMFSALRALHRTADLLIYRDGEHSIVRGSRFRYIDFHEHTLEWWEKYLKPADQATPQK